MPWEDNYLRRQSLPDRFLQLLPVRNRLLADCSIATINELCVAK